MAETTGIQWCDATFNPWRGCDKVSEGCKFCYAEQLVTTRHQLPVWGAQAPRKIAAESAWKLPLRWDRMAQRHPDLCLKCGQRSRGLELCIYPTDLGGACCGELLRNHRPKVFCASLADVFEEYMGPDAAAVAYARMRLFKLCTDTPNLDWLLVTKRPENVRPFVHENWLAPSPDATAEYWPRNVWIGCTAENQKRADERIPHLLKIPAPVRFVSYEPALEMVDFTEWMWRPCPSDTGCGGLWPRNKAPGCSCARPWRPIPGIDWLIVGGESGHGARPFNPVWADRTVTACRAAGVPVFVKQMGSNPTLRNGSGWGWIKHRKGADMSEWPAQLRVREFPKVNP